MTSAFVAPGLLRLHGSAGADVTHRTLENGVTILVQADRNVDTVAISTFIKLPEESEPVPGVGSLLSRCLFTSNVNQSHDSVMRDIYRVGGSVEAYWTPDYIRISIVTARTTFRDAFYVIGQALKEVQFEIGPVEEARGRLIVDCEIAAKDPYAIGYAAARSRIYADPMYRRSIPGDADQIRRVTIAQLANYYHAVVVPSRVVVSVAGNVGADAVIRSADNQLVDFVRKPPRDRGRSEVFAHPLLMETIQRKAPMATRLVAMAYRGPAPADPDYPAFLALEAMLGGGKFSRLFRSVRDVAGVGYAVGSRLNPMFRGSNLITYAESARDRLDMEGKTLNSERVRGLMDGVVQELYKNGPTTAETERTKRYTIGSHVLARQRVKDRAFFVGQSEVFGCATNFDARLPDLIDALKQDDLARTAKKYLGEGATVVVEG